MADGDSNQRTPSQQFLNHWESMLNVIGGGISSTPVSSLPGSLHSASSTDFAENPPLFTCTYCPFILLDAVSLEEHERLHHQGELPDLFNIDDDQLSRHLFGTFSSPTNTAVSKVEICSSSSSSSPNTSGAGIAERQFGRTLQNSQVTQMQSNSISPQNTSSVSLSASRLSAQRTSIPVQMDENSIASSTDLICDENQDVLSTRKGGKGKSRKGQYKCEFCTKTFGYQQNLNQHRRMHTGEKYTCNVCSKEFNFSQNLHQHMRVHSGKKEYKCTHCCKEFNDAANFHRHKRVIHGITGKNSNELPQNMAVPNAHPHMRQTEEDPLKVSMPFSCPRCAMCFVLDSSLQKHLQHCVSPSKDTGSDDCKASPGGASPVTINKDDKAKTGSGGAGKRKREPKKQNATKPQQGNKKVCMDQQHVAPSSPEFLYQQVNKNEAERQPCAYSSPLSNQPSTPLSHYQQQCHVTPSVSQPSPVARQPSPAYLNATSPNQIMQHMSPATTLPQYSTATPSPTYNAASVSPVASSAYAPQPFSFVHVCPYCGFAVTNKLVFQEHLMHHQDSIYHQYHHYLSQGQTTFEAIIANIMASCIQVLNPTVNPPHNSSGSSSSPGTSPTLPGSRKLLQNTPMDAPVAGSPNWLNAQYHHPPAAFQYQHQVSPPAACKQEMDDSGCIVEGEVSPWRLRMDRSGDSPMMQQYRQQFANNH